ncbi:maltose alpha-D-glucosyltransferase [Sulfobacillus sp. hq2]|uniref:maltose alpha-D-glucosyltransferase n=1 Tax=Sulfobacillus sp. hq2 TaxID=2039167 RepID=UPI000CD23CB4|nr:maltose alpha-D-glucosyltransferase [Sulfobacillus sp. hq2]POB09138.1 maltose alpha-D-glucosyltransferase [Sulfobacillus sp. hq2]
MPQEMIHVDRADWYKDAIIYELHVRTFFDSNGDGIGDFVGLTEKLSYLADLGVTALWLLPFYPSPLKDDGYDIADYMNIHPDYGTLRDFRRFLRAAHDLGLKVITELVVNHTSDQHPWFQRARRAPANSRYRNYYVWSDTPDKYADARIIFQDFERSNWTYDDVADAYYWHRFYSHQPDLNFDNPVVKREVFKILDFWLDMGVDGLRLDAVPYLYEREGTNCENLPETHQFLRELRAHIDEKYPSRMLLAEANQWPEDAALYFGNGDECHMAFHFPLMPRMFMALYMEDRYPIMDILEHTPAIPESAQWAIFLRNHDELTLEMVTDEERDYMYRVYGKEPQFRINVGIRRRLAPLLGNNRRRMELMNALLMTLPGTPVLYYGNEIGMGDNVYLGDRDGVRTPFQWSPDRNAGFSRANPQRLCLPVIVDPEYHYESVNVEAQQNNPSSFLWWMRRIIALRKSSNAFGRGALRFLVTDNPKVLAFVREYDSERIMVVANLSRFVQAVTIDTADMIGQSVAEMFSHSTFPPISHESTVYTLGPHDFYLFRLEDPVQELAAPAGMPGPLSVAISDFAQMPRVLDALTDFIPEYLPRQRWFAGKGLRIMQVEHEAWIPVGQHGGLWIIRVRYMGGGEERYELPLWLESGVADAALGLFSWHNETWSVLEGTDYPAFWHDLGRYWIYPERLSSKDFERKTTGAWRNRERGEALNEDPTPLHAEQSNTSVVFGTRWMMKLFRRLEDGINPDWEVGKFLTDHHGEQVAPRTWMGWEYHPGTHQYQLGILQEYVVNHGDAWTYTLDHLTRYFELAAAHTDTVQPVTCHNWWTDRTWVPNETVHAMMGEFIGQAALMGRQTAEMHRLLASDATIPEFRPEPFSALDQRATYQSMRQTADRTLSELQDRLPHLDEVLRPLAEAVIARWEGIDTLLRKAARPTVQGAKIRCHGDYHLGQLLYTGEAFKVVDFEGEPLLSLTQRRIKRSPFKDVAGMVRSFHYAALTQALRQEEFGVAFDTLRPWAIAWFQAATVRFLDSYRASMPAPLLPEWGTDWLSAFILEKAIYELRYELRNRPAWTRIPMEGILSLIPQE